MIEFTPTIRRSKRKTAVIRIYPDNNVVVTAPSRMSIQTIEQFVDTKTPWIQKQLSKNARIQAQKNTYLQENTILYLGNLIALHTLSVGKSAHGLEKWYRTCAQDIFEDRLSIYHPSIQKPLQKLSIRKMKSRWGSCSHTGDITLNLALIKAPIDVIDYVVVHELCHLIHHNHSPDFWQLVSSIFPTYKIQKKWLKDNGFLLIF